MNFLFSFVFLQAYLTTKCTKCRTVPAYVDCDSWEKDDKTWDVLLRLLTFLWSVKQFEARPRNVIIAGKYYFNNIWWWPKEGRKSFSTKSS